jgi:predicted fused transcriptional regulator/phosphomethylpyrimidine kinase/predicted transcriptional regulator
MPALRAETARRLVREGIQQDRIAEHLGVSQAMVSKYLRKAPRDGVASPALVTELVDASVRVALDDESKGRISPWCPVCVSLSGRGFARATTPLPGLSECLRHDAPSEEGGSGQVLANLTEAEARLRRLRFAPLMPQVRSNLALALPNAKNTRDVASFPGRLLEIRGEVHAAAAPEFGSSSHLAHLLLRVRRSQSTARAILNVRYDDLVRRAVRAAGLRLHVLQRVRGELVVALPATPPIDAVADPGAFGVEPALYLLGENAVDVVQKAGRLLVQLQER